MAASTAGVGTPRILEAEAPEPPSRELVARTAVLLRRAILTMKAIPDREAAWRSGPRCALPRPKPDYDPTYDEHAERSVTPPPRFAPSREDLARVDEVLSWLAWLRRQDDEFGARGAAIVAERAMGRPYWRIARRKYGVSDDTLRRWEMAAIAAIAARFRTRIEVMS